MKEFFPLIENARRKQDLMTFQQRDKENLINTWRRFKRIKKACAHHCIPECVLMEQFYFGLSEDTQQTTDVVFVGGMLRSS